jgi:hypothetical protein
MLAAAFAVVAEPRSMRKALPAAAAKRVDLCRSNVIRVPPESEDRIR